MQDKVEELIGEIKSFVASNKDELERYRMKFISKKSVISALFTDLKAVPSDQKRSVAIKLNELKTAAQDKFQSLIAELENANDQSSHDHIDLTLPSAGKQIGGMHPLSYVRYKII